MTKRVTVYYDEVVYDYVVAFALENEVSISAAIQILVDEGIYAIAQWKKVSHGQPLPALAM